MYQAGATSLLDVLDAQRAYNDTMDTYYAAQAAPSPRPGQAGAGRWGGDASMIGPRLTNGKPCTKPRNQ